MWTEITRPKYERKHLGYSSKLSDAEWATIEARLPQRNRLARPPKTEMRIVVNALLYMLRTGCQWRQLPCEFPPFTTMQHYFYAWRDSGVLERINFELLMQAREAAGREPSPSAGVIDSQSVKTTEAGGPRGFDAAKKIKGRKRHVVTDTIGLLVGAQVHVADVQDRDGAPLVIAAIHDPFPWLRHLFADSDLCRRQAPKYADQIQQLDDRGRASQSRRRGFYGSAPPLGRRTHPCLARLAKDFEATIASAKAWLYLASVQLLLRRLARA